MRFLFHTVTLVQKIESIIGLFGFQVSGVEKVIKPAFKVFSLRFKCYNNFFEVSEILKLSFMVVLGNIDRFNKASPTGRWEYLARKQH